MQRPSSDVPSASRFVLSPSFVLLILFLDCYSFLLSFLFFSLLPVLSIVPWSCGRCGEGLWNGAQARPWESDVSGELQEGDADWCHRAGRAWGWAVDNSISLWCSSSFLVGAISHFTVLFIPASSTSPIQAPPIHFHFTNIFWSFFSFHSLEFEFSLQYLHVSGSLLSCTTASPQVRRRGFYLTRFACSLSLRFNSSKSDSKHDQSQACKLNKEK